VLQLKDQEQDTMSSPSSGGSSKCDQARNFFF
jgi:hypothetical protein